ncbi:MAG: hypothetical protein K0M64_09225, partial [Rhizobium sp.]|nr:hypothetical protein [Rhizobium sp.]
PPPPPAPTVVATAPVEVAATTAPAAAPAVAHIAPATPEPPQPATAPITEAAAQAILGQYTAAYASGDIRSLMRLFTRDATNNRGNRDAIAYDYQELFSSSETREITLSTTGWLASGGTATVLAKYEAKVKRPGRWLPGTSRGDIRFDFAYENGALRIRNIRHD